MVLKVFPFCNTTIHLNIFQSPKLLMLLEINSNTFVFFLLYSCKHCHLCPRPPSNVPSWNIPIKAQCKPNESVCGERALVIHPNRLLMEEGLLHKDWEAKNYIFQPLLQPGLWLDGIRNLSVRCTPKLNVKEDTDFLSFFCFHRQMISGQNYFFWDNISSSCNAQFIGFMVVTGIRHLLVWMTSGTSLFYCWLLSQLIPVCFLAAEW